MAHALEARPGLFVTDDKYHEAEYARYDLGISLPKLYRDESDLFVAVLCPDYYKKPWTGWEFRRPAALQHHAQQPPPPPVLIWPVPPNSPPSARRSIPNPPPGRTHRWPRRHGQDFARRPRRLRRPAQPLSALVATQVCACPAIPDAMNCPCGDSEYGGERGRTQGGRTGSRSADAALPQLRAPERERADPVPLAAHALLLCHRSLDESYGTYRTYESHQIGRDRALVPASNWRPASPTRSNARTSCCFSTRPRRRFRTSSKRRSCQRRSIVPTQSNARLPQASRRRTAPAQTAATDALRPSRTLWP